MKQAQMVELAEMAVRGMNAKEASAFVTMFETGRPDIAGLFGKQAALRTISRNITMANMALGDPQVMSALVDAVEAA